MKSLIFNLQLVTILLLLQGFLCTKSIDMPITQETVEYFEENQKQVMQAERVVLEGSNVKTTVKGNHSPSYSNSKKDDSWYHISVIENSPRSSKSSFKNGSSSSSSSIENISFPSNSSIEDCSRSFERSPKDVQCSTNSINEDALCSSIRLTEHNSHSSNLSIKDDSCSSDGLIKNNSCSSNGSIENDSCSSNLSAKDDSCSSDGSIKDDSCSSDGSIENKSCSSNGSIENDSCSSKLSAKDDSCSSDGSIKDDSRSSDGLIENNSCSSNGSIENDSCSSNLSAKDDSCSSDGLIENDDDDDNLELVNDFSFEKSTLIYLMAILDKLKNESTAVTDSFDSEKLLIFFDKLISLIDLFMEVFSCRKYNVTAILKDKMNKINSNFNSLETTLLEMDKMIDGVMSNNKKSKFKLISKSSKKLKRHFDNVKKVFEKHKVRWEQIGDFNSNNKIKALNEYKYELIEIRDIVAMDEEKIENEVEKFDYVFYKNMFEFFENLNECLKTEHNLLKGKFQSFDDLHFN